MMIIIVSLALFLSHIPALASTSNDETNNNIQEHDENELITVRAVDVLHIQSPTLEESKAVLQRVTAGGEDFATVAQQVSKCPSRKRGGKLGHITPNTLAVRFQEFEPYLFKHPAPDVGTVHGPIQTLMGFHLVYIKGYKEVQEKRGKFDPLMYSDQVGIQGRREPAPPPPPQEYFDSYLTQHDSSKGTAGNPINDRSNIPPTTPPPDAPPKNDE
eukprot:PhF_6_TR31143/c0_g1_i3/m.45618